MRAWWQRLTPSQQFGRATVAGTAVFALLAAAILPLIGGPWS